MGASKHTVSRTASRDWPDDNSIEPTGQWERESKTPHDPDTAVEQTFLLRIRDQPDDVGMRMVFADWLEERNHTQKAEFLRLAMRDPDATVVPKVAERMRALAALLPPVWRAIVSRTQIEKCPGVNFSFKCPRSWEALAGTDESMVRHCGTCARNVYFCTSLDEVATHGRQGNCVAFCSSLVRERALEEYEGDEVEMGEISYVEDE